MKKTMCCVAMFALCSVLAVPATALSGVNERLAKIRYMPEEPIIKVLLAQGQEKINVEIHGPHNVYDPFTGKKLDAAFMASSYPVLPTRDGLRWGQEFPGVYQLVIVPDGTKASVLVNGVGYPGVVVVYQVEDKLAAVNWVSLEDFTASLLSSSLFPGEAEDKEAIAAYAIAVRSKAYQQLSSPASRFWDISKDDCAYRGLTVVRLDACFAEAMQSSRRIVFQSSMVGGGRLGPGSIEEIRHQMPVQKVQALAKEGKDARQILEKFYSGQGLCVADRNPVVQ